MPKTDRSFLDSFLLYSCHQNHINKLEPISARFTVSPDQVIKLAPSPTLRAKKRVKFTGAPLLKEPWFIKNSFDIGFYSSLSLHGIVALAFCITLIAHFHFSPKQYGNSEEGQKPVEVMFVPSKAGSSGLTGSGFDGNETEDMSPPLLPPPSYTLPETTPPLPPKITSTSPKALSLPNMKALETIPLPNKQKYKTPQRKTEHSNKSIERYYTFPQQHPKMNTTSPFDNLSSLDFNEVPGKSRRKQPKRMSRGSHSGIDISTGSLVKNGKLHIPYAAKVNVKGVSDDYGQEIQIWIHRHLYYPPEAAMNGEEGAASVHVTLGRDGQVRSIVLTNSSGSSDLDDATTGMFRNAILPMVPPDLPGDHFDIDLTVNYILIRH